jgi:hypothetical protein
MRTLTMLVALTVVARIGLADPLPPVTDHLQCYRVRDPQRHVTYTADLDGLTVAHGCVIRLPAKLTCVPTAKENVTPTPPGGGPTGVPNGFNCYAVKCPKGPLPEVPTADQFGSRIVVPSKSSLLCAPFAPPTTTTTTTETTTTTLALTCAGGLIACGKPCGNGCTCMGPGTAQFCSGIHCGAFDQACVNTSVGAGAPCSFDVDCPAGQACAGVPNTCTGGPFGPGACFPVCPE